MDLQSSEFRLTPAQRMFYLHDILGQIIDHLTDRTSLHALTLTHSTCYFLAARHLWAKLDSLRPLIALLPTDKLPSSLHIFSRLQLTGAEDDTLSRWRLYSPFVSSVSLDFCLLGKRAPLRHFWQYHTVASERLDQLNRDVMHSLEPFATPEGIILPNLREVVMKSYTPTGCEAAKILSPCLDRLCITLPGKGSEGIEESSEQSVFTLPPHFPHLRSLVIDGSEGTLPGRKAVIQALQDLPLTSFKIKCNLARSADLLLALSTLPLQELEIDDTSQRWPTLFVNDERWGDMYDSPLADFLGAEQVTELHKQHKLKFPHLTELTVASTLPFCCAMIRALGANLTRLKVQTILPRSEDLQTLTEAISSHALKLHHLSLILRDADSLTSACWPAIYTLSKLDMHTFQLECRYGHVSDAFQVSEERLALLVSGWNGVREVKVGTVRRDGWGLYPLQSVSLEF
ncbi:hypothetical protein DACRYDRAFT_23411 [Dacryopinax primogenitus]|uniref:F-box domain-containing protein n=1 Tax=Dacryopinax primogenitus (strain DJM 731) TaxID=1858805 RepID=M5FW17_DACPD|nr:uncharacterized protein DACRYDRAFT_23411 [Dacryopinax primogenitus]EJT99839.1 hypothetical protein DACRYDRAFT_23411 [Dacryopinax primogenitus]